MLVNPSARNPGRGHRQEAAIHAGEATVILYVDQNMERVMRTFDRCCNGVRTEVIPTTAQALAAGSVPQDRLFQQARNQRPTRFRGSMHTPCSTRPSPPSSRSSKA